ncbi:WSC domain-containing protein 1-like [Mya arenaria]|uniref:WSC domain-containing protein 1-like n=1 Tax=Mya arenaria TaxID=6604 RepID=UPI0022E59704|nr:WSC domain-containing protein 1-like [Mya arenaria]
MNNGTFLKFVGNVTLVRPFLRANIAQLPDTTIKINSTLGKHVIAESKKHHFTWIFARSRNLESGISKYVSVHNVRTMQKSEAIKFTGNDVNCSEWLPKQLELVPIKVPRTALSSPWRSGNTWLRHLVQQATGYGTSSIYCDKELLAKGYPFECEKKQQDRTILIKTHKPEMRSFEGNISLPFAKRLVERMSEYHRAVLLIRNPYEFLVANKYFEHLDELPEEAFLNEKSYWRKGQPKIFQWWLDFNHYWLHEFKGPVLPVLYSRLRHDAGGELKRILDFMHVNVTELDIKCAQANGEGNFHRKPSKWTKINSIVDLFPADFQRRINASVSEFSKHLKSYHNVDWVSEYDILYTKTQDK